MWPSPAAAAWQPRRVRQAEVGDRLNLNPVNRRFDHEKLEVYRASLAFISWLEPILRQLPNANSDDRLHEPDAD